MSNLRTYRKAFQKAEAVCLRAASGDLEARIVGIEEFGELAGCLNAINRLLDLTDAFVRESSASLEYASQRKYFRRSFCAVCRAISGAARRSSIRRASLWKSAMT